MTFLDDSTAKIAFVSNGAGITSSPSGAIPAIPGGCTVTGATANATVPPTPLPCTLADGNVGSDNSTSLDPDVYTTGTDPFFKFGTLVNADNDPDDEFVVVEFNALVDNNATANSNDYGYVLSNTFVPQVNETSVGAVSAAVAVNVSEPCLGTLSGTTCTSNLNKVVQTLPVPADAGGVVAYRITFSNATGASISTALTRAGAGHPAGDLAAEPTERQSVTGEGAAPTNASTGNTLDVTIATIPPGGTVQIDYTATLLVGVQPGATVNNTSSLTYTSSPGAGTPNGQPGNSTGSTTPGASGATNGERGGSVTAPNDYLGTDPASFTIIQGSRAKYLVATSEASTADPRVTIGEIVRYRLVWQLPEGTTPNAQFLDNLPAGLTFLDDSTAKIAFVSNGAGITSAAFGSHSSHPGRLYGHRRHGERHRAADAAPLHAGGRQRGQRQQHEPRSGRLHHRHRSILQVRHAGQRRQRP